MMFLPFVALWPPLVHLDIIRDVFDLPCLKFVVHNTFNIGFAAFASLYGPEMCTNDEYAKLRYILLLLAVSDLWNELLLMTDACARPLAISQCKRDGHTTHMHKRTDKKKDRVLRAAHLSGVTLFFA